VGKDAAASAELSARLEEAYPDCEITMYDGGQGVYDYLVAVE
jgi:dihydroxyacetone kinase-like predicted kinase